MKIKKELRILIVFFILIILFAIVKYSYRYIEFLEGTSVIKGVIYEKSGNRTGTWIKYKYSIDGKEYIGRYKLKGEELVIGDSINIEYAIKNPEESQLP